MNIWSLLTCGLLFAAVIFTIGHAGMEAELQQQNLYCEMREIHKQTKGEYGWPSFDKAAEGECK